MPVLVDRSSVDREKLQGQLTTSVYVPLEIEPMIFEVWFRFDYLGENSPSPRSMSMFGKNIDIERSCDTVRGEDNVMRIVDNWARALKNHPTMISHEAYCNYYQEPIKKIRTYVDGPESDVEFLHSLVDHFKYMVGGVGFVDAKKSYEESQNARAQLMKQTHQSTNQ